MPIQEISAALLSSTLISPCMAVIDLTLHRRHQSSDSLMTSLRHTFSALRTSQISLSCAYWPMKHVYFFTFATANLTESYGVPTLPAMGLTTLVNVLTMARKDRYYAALWNKTVSSSPSAAPALPLPLLSRVLSTTGALFTVYAQFVQRHSWEQEMIRLGMNPTLATFFSSATISMAAQLISTPLHLLAMDLSLYPERTIRQRLVPLLCAYPAVCAGRMLRVLPAFGGGGYVNEQGKRWKFEGMNK